MSKCDFCSEPHAEWIYPARSFAQHNVGWGSEGNLAACEDCSQLIEGETYETLVAERMLASTVATYHAALWGILSKDERKMVKSKVRKLINKFPNARTAGRKLLSAA